MGGIIELATFMLIIAGIAFLPLGYFIYMYTMKKGEPFGDTEPHGDRESIVLVYAEKLVNAVKDIMGKK
ncbi:MAG: hypothetical protein PHW13_06405 [Methylococcales bacterium]|nr:hypothetical protein [Methylococcales bacterium]